MKNSRLVVLCCALLVPVWQLALGSDLLEPVDPPSGAGSLAPRLAPDGAGALLVWLDETGRSESGRVYALRFSRFADDAWTEPVTIREGDDFFANWADLPCIARSGDGSLLASWLQMAGPGTYAYHVMLARSTDDGKTWTELGRLHDDASETEHGFVSMLPEDDGVRVFWLDGRKMKPDGGDHGGMHMGMGDMTLRTAFVGADGAIGESTELDARTCECCATDAAQTADGPLVVYRDRSDREIRDTAVVRVGADGWTEPYIARADNWIMPACPVNGPSVDAAGQHVALAWFTMAGGRATALAAFSDDGGATFGEPIEIAGGGDAGFALGRTDIVLSDSGDDALVVWMHGVGKTGEIRARRVRKMGGADPAYTLAQTGASRSSGFPKLVRLGESNEGLLVWTGVEQDGSTRVHAGVIALD
jgi:hypothetical protein